MCEMHDSDERANSIARYNVASMGGWWVDDVAELHGFLEKKYNGVIVTLVKWDSGTDTWQCRPHVNDALFPFKPVNLTVPSPSSWAGTHRHEDATCRLWTMGLDTEGIAYNRDPEVIHDQIAKKLQGDGYNIPRGHIYDCTPLKNNDISGWHFRSCTGRNKVIFESVWKHRDIGKIAWMFAAEYNEFKRTRVPGEEFHAVFYSINGNHRSVAVALGLRNWLWETNENIHLILCHKNETQHRRRFCDPDRCEFCSRWPRRTEWELNLVEKALYA